MNRVFEVIRMVCPGCANEWGAEVQVHLDPDGGYSLVDEEDATCADCDALGVEV